MNQKLLNAIQTQQALKAMRGADYFVMSISLATALEEKIQKQADLILDLYEELNPGFKAELEEIAKTIS